MVKRTVKKFGSSSLHVTLAKSGFRVGEEVEVLKKSDLVKLIEKIVDKRLSSGR